MNKKGFTLVEVVVVVLVLTAIGTLTWRAVSNNDTTLSSADSNVETRQITDDLNELLTLEEVNTIAAENAEGVEVAGIKLANEDGVDVYEVRLSNGDVIYVNALTGELMTDMQSDDDGSESDSDDIPLTAAQLSSVKISFNKAVEIAKNRYPNVAVEDVELEVEDGRVVYSVDFVDDTRVDVNAVDGEVVRFKTDDVDERSDDSNSSSDDSTDDSRDDSSGNDDSDSDDDDSGSDSDDDDLDDDKDDDSDNSGSGSDNSGSGSSN